MLIWSGRWWRFAPPATRPTSDGFLVVDKVSQTVK
jgi:hypothetical protein